MKVLHVTSDWKWTGPAEPMLHAVTGLRARGHTVELACPEAPRGLAGLPERARARGVEPALSLELARGYRPWRDRSSILRLRRWLAERSYHVVHAHHTRAQLLARLALRRAGRAPPRLVVSWHHAEPLPTTPWSRLLLGPRGAGGLAVLSPGLAEQAQSELGWDPARVAVIPGCVDTERFAPRPRRRDLAASLGIDPAQRVIGVVARLQPHRRFELLLDAFARALASAPSLRLVVVGRGTRAREVLEEPVRRRGLEASVVRAGYRGEDYLDVLALFDALVFLVPGSDGSCRAVLEAMSLEIPVIASRRGILPETLADAETGWLVDERPEPLTEALLRVAKEPELARELGRAARRRALARHAIPLVAERLERFYAGLCGSESSRSTSSR